MIKITCPDIGNIRIKLDRLSKQFAGRELMSGLAQLALFRIKSRTAKGLDSDGNPFQPYSKGYQFFRQESGHPSSKVNLFFSGGMTAAMDHKVTSDTTAELFFNNPREAAKAHGHNFGSKRLPKREFFSLSKDDLNALMDEASRHIDSKVGGHGF